MIKNIIRKLKKILRFIKWFWWYFVYSLLVIIFWLVFIYVGLSPLWFIVSILGVLVYGLNLIVLNDDDYFLFEVKNDEEDKRN